MPITSLSTRYSLTEADPHESRGEFASEVRKGLASVPKQLPCRFLYDEVGSQLFEEICDLPEYYLTRAEDEILERSSDEIASCLAEPVALVELGSGSSTKTRRLIEALLRRQGRLRYVPVDISRSILDESARSLLESYGGLEIHAIAAEYQEGLRHVRRERTRAKLLAWLGSNVGNFDRAAAAGFLRTIRAAMRDEDHLLIGVDLRKGADVLEPAYDDPAGVTARFNKNLLGRINRELGGHFDLDRFEHRATWREREGRVELGLVSREAQTVAIDGLDAAVEFEAGEFVHTEDSHKYSLDELAALARESGMESVRHWLDAGERFSLSLLRPR